MNWVNELFEGLIEEDMINRIIEDFDGYKDVTIFELGVDSLDVMNLVLNIEEKYDKDINFDDFNIDTINTPQKIQDYISEG